MTDRTRAAEPVRRIEASPPWRGHGRGRAGVAALGIFVVISGMLGTPNVVQASGTGLGRIATFAGGAGRGPAVDVAQRPVAVTLTGNHLLIADALNVVRSLDLSNGIESVVAGLGGLSRGPGGYSGDGGPASAARLASPLSTAVDGAGNVYIADNLCLIRKVDHATGIVTTVAGHYPCSSSYSGEGGPATAAQLGSIRSVVVDKAGNLLLADDRFYRVYRVTGGVITTVAGTGEFSGVSTGDGGLATRATMSPESLALDKSGNVYLIDSGEGVRRIDYASGFITATATGVRGTTLAVNGDSTQLYVGDIVQVFKVDLSTHVTARVAGFGVSGFAGDGGPAKLAMLSDVEGVAVGPAGLFIADSTNFRIRRVLNGRITTVAGNGSDNFGGNGVSARWAQMGQNLPAVVTDTAGNSYVSDLDSSRVRKIDATGIMTTVAGNSALNTFVGGYSGDGGPAVKADLNYPTGLAVDADTLYLADTGNCRVRTVKAGIISTAVGNGHCYASGDGGPAASATLEPVSLAFDKDHNLYIGGNCRVRVIDHATGVISTAVGTGTCGFYGDGGPARSAHLGTQSDLKLDGFGNLFISDASNCVVRRVGVSQTITTVAGVSGTPGACSPSSGDGGPATAARVDPHGIAVDRDGAIYIADSCSIRRVTAGVIDVVVGVTLTDTQHDTCDFSGDGGPAAAATVSNPQGLNIVGRTLYIADSTNQRIRTVALG